MSESETMKVKMVKQIIDTAYTNELLKKGWKLLDTYTVGIPSDSGPSQMVGYVLGWTGDGDPPA